MEVYQVLYVSSANEGLDEESLLEILKHARIKNEINGITGLLLYADHSIIQLLEGDVDSVEKTFRSISADPRHTGIIKLIAEFTDQRDFADWSMGFKSVDSKALNDVDGFNDLLEKRPLESDALETVSSKVRTLVNTFRKTARV